MKVKGGVQPYAKGEARMPGQALQNMLRGRTIGGQNPMDAMRQKPGATNPLHRKKRKKRPVRVPRAFR